MCLESKIVFKTSCNTQAPKEKRQSRTDIEAGGLGSVYLHSPYPLGSHGSCPLLSIKSSRPTIANLTLSNIRMGYLGGFGSKVFGDILLQPQIFHNQLLTPKFKELSLTLCFLTLKYFYVSQTWELTASLIISSVFLILNLILLTAGTAKMNLKFYFLHVEN